ncbi:MAG: tRNA (adenosine(37)-N6)-threonylcarbamoyltransferase complex dimerization subunit type 1 TsaB [Acidobacteria bacterium]|nr:tRNA (adenosine(37)-N6)-threonylcarbamoyltransferase complex dimerization subunit type 1 TsaB [Acidobacteriota bacterium]
MSTRILALDTTGEIGSLALIEDGAPVFEVQLQSPEGFAHLIHDLIRQQLELRQLRLEQVDCYAAAAGPGAFTGVRVGLAAAQGLAEAFGKPVVAVSNLQALAAFGSLARRAVFFDARRGEIYGALYDENLGLVMPEVVTRFPAWLEALPEGELEFLSTHLAPFRDALASSRFAPAPARETPRALAGAIGRIAAARFAAGQALDPAQVDANYVRRSDAEMFWKDV